MSGYDNLNTRLKYYGGGPQQRLENDKLRSLKKALYSYQHAIIQLEDGREFRSLINNDKLKGDYDNEVISIPYADVCLNKDKAFDKTSDAIEEIGLKPGDTFLWKDNDTHWLVYLKYLKEKAYFRAEIRRCDQQVTVNDKKYWAYIRGPVETSIPWNQKGGIEWNDTNYSLVMYITKNDDTSDFFHRFQVIKVEEESGKEKTWQVVGVNPYYGDGIIQVYLDEYYENTIADKAEIENKAKKNEEMKSSSDIYINGQIELNPYDEATYTIVNSSGGSWSINNKRIKILSQDSESVSIGVLTGKQGEFTLTYAVGGEVVAAQTITIKPF